MHKTTLSYNKGRNPLGELVGNPGWQLVCLVGCSLNSTYSAFDNQLYKHMAMNDSTC